MIEAVYYREFNRVTVTGHAGSGPEGHDIVCAAVSVLAVTLAANVSNMQKQGAVRDVTIELDLGKAEICCKPVQKYRASVEQIFRAICVGFELLADKFPGNIQYEVRG